MLLSPHLTMSAGKAMAQAAHAAQLGWRTLSAPDRTAWRDAGFAVAVRTATPRQWADAVGRGVSVVQDAGFTEIPPGSETAAFVWR